jgi:uncharacterized protein YmfQ (DUF2313 family)
MANLIWDTANTNWDETSVNWDGDGAPVVPGDGLAPESNFNAPSLLVSATQLAEHLPQGRAWGSKNIPDANLHKIIKSMAASFNRVQQQIELLSNELNIPLTNDLLPDWEASVGLPDDCQGIGQALAERRENVISRLRRLPIVTVADFEALGEELSGEPVTVIPGTDIDVPLDRHSRFKLFVQFPNQVEGFIYDFEVPFGNFRSDIVQCVFEKIVPANVIVVI